MPKLSDTQLILLSAAAQRADGSLLPYPATLTDVPTVADKAIPQLIKRGLAEQRELADHIGRADGDGMAHVGMFITDAGKAAIGICDEGVDEGEVPQPPASTSGHDPEPAPLPAASAQPDRPSKRTAVIELLHRDEGATLTELIALTNWLPHTTRAALTGLRHKGHVITRSKRGTQTCYHINGAV